MAAHRSKDTGINRSPADHSVGFGSRHWPAGRLFLVEGLKERLGRALLNTTEFDEEVERCLNERLRAKGERPGKEEQ
jgi:hypothetical protein